MKIEKFLKLLAKKHGITNTKAIIIHNQDFHGKWVEYSLMSEGLGHSSRSIIKRITNKELKKETR